MTLVTGPNSLEGSVALSDLPIASDRFLQPGQEPEVSEATAEILLEVERARAPEFEAQGIPVITESTVELFASLGFITPPQYRELAWDIEESDVKSLIGIFGNGNVAVGGLTEEGNYLPLVPGVRQFSVILRTSESGGE